MKNLRLFPALAPLILLAGSLLVTEASAQSAPPVAEWKLDEGGTAIAGEASGKGTPGLLMGDASWTTGITSAHALKLSQTGRGFVDIAQAVVDTSLSYTVTAWVKMNEVGGYQTIVSIDGNKVSGFFLQVRPTAVGFTLAVLPTDDPAANTPALASGTSPVTPGVWYHLAGVHDAGAQTISLYVNGVLQQTTPFQTPWRAEGHTAIGRGKFDGNPTDFLNGDVDDVRFYKGVLPPADILAMAKTALPSSTLTIDAGHPGIKVSPLLYGLMTEEINYSYDGGLLAELIRNRAFLDPARNDDPTTPAHWARVQTGAALGSVSVDSTQPMSAARPNSLKLTIDAASGADRVGAANDGYWGIPVRPNTRYQASVWARAAPGFTGPLTLDIESADGAVTYAKASVPKLSPAWKQYRAELRVGAAVPTTAARFVLSASTPGTVEFAQVSLTPPTYKGLANGFRPDLMEKLAAMKPAFLRLPGGNYLEGDTIPTRFDWKKTLGPIEGRAGHQGPWGYRSTDGMGLYEYLLWCEQVHMEPVLAVYAGYSLKGDHIDAGPGLEPFVQDALDEIEYVTGDRSTPWGARRAAAGHPAPFPLHFVEIGNEDEFDRSGSYSGRFGQFADAIKARYPKLLTIATTGVKGRQPDVIDEHYYRLSADFIRDAHHYDSYSRTGPKIFVGEWASQRIERPWEQPTNGDPTPDLEAALADAAWMTGMERNSDVVLIESYAPLLVNVNRGGRQWPQNLIGYDGLTSYGSPSYYAQAMFANSVGDTFLPGVLSGAVQMAYSTTIDSKTGTVYLKLVNTGMEAQPLKISLTGLRSVDGNATAVTLTSAGRHDTNSLEAPTKVSPVTTRVSGAGPSFTYIFPASSVTVLRIGTK